MLPWFIQNSPHWSLSIITVGHTVPPPDHLHWKANTVQLWNTTDTKTKNKTKKKQSEKKFGDLSHKNGALCAKVCLKLMGENFSIASIMV